jgi:monofunctional biosynthetic peptidoglycan transglycosylase
MEVQPAPKRHASAAGFPARLRAFLRSVLSLRRIVLAIMVLVAIPALLTIAYLPHQVRPVSTLMLARWVTGAEVDRRWVPIEEVAPVLLHSVIMSEDGQFCSHPGVDWRELSGVIDDALDGESPRGASTLTMQTVKNLYLWGGRSYVRKALEIPLALYFDLLVPKKRILEIYVNIAEWGDGIFGIEAAAQRHFGRSAAKLTRQQAALLTVSLPNPLARNPAKPGRTLQRLAGVIEGRARQAGGYVECVR